MAIFFPSFVILSSGQDNDGDDDGDGDDGDGYGDGDVDGDDDDGVSSLSTSPSPSPSPSSLSKCSFSENNPCSEDPEYSFRACVSIWVARKAGCHLDWFRSSSSSYVVIATLAVLVLFGRAAKPLHFNANNALPQKNLSENHPP